MSKFSYWAVYADNGTPASLRGAKKTAEGVAQAMSHPQMGTGRKVCIMREEAGAGLGGSGGAGTGTGVCYVGGIRERTRRPRQKKPPQP